MNLKKSELMQSLRSSAGGVQIAGVLFWLVVLTASFARQFLQTRQDGAAAQGEETERAAHDRGDEDFEDHEDAAMDPTEAS